MCERKNEQEQWFSKSSPQTPGGLQTLPGGSRRQTVSHNLSSPHTDVDITDNDSKAAMAPNYTGRHAFFTTTD